jgi:hypothetical protein
VTYNYSWNDYWYRNWRLRLADRRRSLQAAQKTLGDAQAQLQVEQRRLAGAVGAYAERKQGYDARFAETYNTRYEQLKVDLAARAASGQGVQQFRVQREVEGRSVPGDYVLVHNGRDLGTLTLFDDGSLTTISGERRYDYQWEATPDGLVILLRDVEWFLTPGPNGSWLGKCQGPALEIKGLSAMLRPL